MKTTTLVTLLAAAGLALAVRAADFTAQVNDLIPKLAAADVGSRYDAQMQLQAIAANTSKPGNDADRAALGTVLAAKAGDAAVPQPARVWIVRQLEYMGRGEAVAALTALLSGPDAELRECARRALEKNPDAKATDSLRAELQKGGDARWKIGLMRSLSEKRDAASVALIVPALNDAALSRAAAKALGQIATPEAVAALWGAFGKVDAAAESLVCAANRDAAQAAAIGQKLYATSNESAVRAAGLAIVAKVDPGAAAKLIDDALASNDVRLQKAAVDVAPAEKIAAALPNMPAPAKVFALRVVEVEPAAVECAADKDEAVRVAALEALGRIGTAAGVPALLKAAANGSEAEKTAAATSLGRIKGYGAGDAILKQAAQGEARVVAITALAARATKAALPALGQYAGEPDAAVSKAALQTIAKIGGDESLDGLVTLVQAGKPGAKEALQTVANRSTDKSGVGQKLAAQARNARGAQLVAILDVMSLVGGASSLQEVVTFAGSSDAEVKDGAIRALCGWREWPAVKPLLAVASTAGAKQVHQVLAIQAVSRLVKSEEDEPAQLRVEAALAALNAAGRPQEKTQAISALAAIKDRKAADALIKLLADPAVKMDAAHAALNLADALRKPDRGSAKRLAEAVQKANLSPDLTKRAGESLRKK